MILATNTYTRMGGSLVLVDRGMTRKRYGAVVPPIDLRFSLSFVLFSNVFVFRLDVVGCGW